MNLTDEAALAWLTEWDRGNSPPKGEQRLREIIAGAHDYGTRGYGSELAHADAIVERFVGRPG